MDHDVELADSAFDRLPLGAIEPQGWLDRQLRIQAENITGPLDRIWDELSDNQWQGGSRDGWERGPYYADGLVPLAELVEDDELTDKARSWVEAFLDWRQDDGWIGPRDPAFDSYPPGVWPRAIVLKVFRQYYEATNDERVLDAALEFCNLLATSELEEDPLDDWGKFRWQDLSISIHWLYEETGAEWLLDLGATIREQGYDWREHFAGGRRKFYFKYSAPAPEWTFETHVVNNAMGVKAPAVAGRETRDPQDSDASRIAIDVLDAFHGQATGVFTGDENLGGRSPTRGTELCAVVEYMFSLETLVEYLGDVAFADRLERLAFNALPATFSADMCAHQYDQQANQVMCSIGEYPWTNGPDANLFAMNPHYGCCTANLHQGWPKFAARLWMRAQDGLVAVAYAPNRVTHELEDGHIQIDTETRYPFGDEITARVSVSTPTDCALYFRIPEWADEPTMETPDETTSPDSGTFHRIDRTWEDGDVVTIDLAPSITPLRRYQGAVALQRGPLVFSLPIEAQETRLPGEPDSPYAHRELHPLDSWNYGLDINPEADRIESEVSFSDIPDLPFDPASPPLEMTLPGARVPDWELDGVRAGELPASPVPADEQESVTLVPYGSTDLRITEFPLIK